MNNRPALPRRLGIIGLGLIGGSVACAARRVAARRVAARQVATQQVAAPEPTRIIAYDADSAATQHALDQGIIDQAATSIADLQQCDLTVVAVPVAAYANVFKSISEWDSSASPARIVTDTGSVKRNIVAAAREHFANTDIQFVASHPIAGKENSSLAAAAPDLFHDCKIIICCDNVADDATLCVSAFWRSLGAQVVHMNADKHDRIFSFVSHLPHLLSYALVNVIAQHPDRDELIDYVAGGFRDFTRIASSHPIMWRDIAVANNDNLAAAMTAMQNELAAQAGMISAQDAAALERRFASAKTARDTWIKTKKL